MDGNNTLTIIEESDTTEGAKDFGRDETYHGNKAASTHVACHEALIAKEAGM